jgi:hypothetical protein
VGRPFSLWRAHAVAAILAAVSACGGSNSSPSSSTAAPLPLAAENADFRFYYSAGDSVQIDRQEAHHVWATTRLGVVLPAKIDYRKYSSLPDMGARTGHYGTNAYAEPDVFTIHTIWSWDKHETVHVYTARIGYPSEFFNEGIAVAFGTDPPAGDFEPRFNGEALVDSARRYLQSGQLVLPLSRLVATPDFRSITDDVLSYREAGAFVAFLITRFGMDPLLQFFRISARDDPVEVIRQRFAAAFGATLDAAEADWLASLHAD